MIGTEQYAKAVEIYSKVLENNLPYDFNVKALCNRALAHKNVGNFSEAVNDYSDVLLLVPDRTDLRQQRAECYDYLEEWEKCVEDYEFVSQTDAIKNDCVIAADIQVNLKIVREKMQRKLAEQKNIDGNEQFGLKEYSMAGKLYSEAIELWPDNVIFYGNRCTCLIMLGDYKQALKDAKYIRIIDENCVMGYQHLIKCSLILGDYDVASRSIDELIAIVGDETACSEYTDLYTQLLSCEELALQSYREKQYWSAGALMIYVFLFEIYFYSEFFSMAFWTSTENSP